MKSSTYTLSYIFVTNVCIIVYGIIATSGLTVQEIQFHNCAEEFFAIILTYISCILVVLMLVVKCIYQCFHYTLDDNDDTTLRVVYRAPLGLRTGVTVLGIIVVNIWNCVVALDRSGKHRDCMEQYQRTHKSIIALNHLMAGNAASIALIFTGLWVHRRCRRQRTMV